MLNVAITGHAGAMGANLIEMISVDPTLNLVAGIDQNKTDAVSFKEYTSFSDLDSDTSIVIDVIIDFSHHSLVSSMLDYIRRHKIPAVICTTGISETDLKLMDEIKNEVPIFKSGNMSLGINLLIELSRRASEIIGDSFDIEIIEKHHNRKVDAPSGTALMIADGINNIFSNSMSYKHGRSGNDCKRKPDEIGIHAVRGGTIVGEHTVIFSGNDEILELTHKAGSRKVFAKGSIDAAKFLVRQIPGLYDMKKLLSSTID